MTLVKPTFPPAEEAYKYLASSGLTVAQLQNICIKEAEVIGVSGLNEIDVRLGGVDYHNVPVWIHTDCGSRVKLAKGAEESALASAYFRHSALHFPFQQGFVYHIYGESPPQYHYVMQQIVLVMVHTDPETSAVSIIAAVRIILGPTGLNKFLLGEFFDNKPAETYRMVIEVRVYLEQSGETLEYSLWDAVEEAPVNIPTYIDGVAGPPFYPASGISYEDSAVISFFLWGSLFDSAPPSATMEVTDYGDMGPGSGGVPTHTIITQGQYVTCKNEDGTTGLQVDTSIPEGGAYLKFNEIGEEYDLEKTFIHTAPCYGYVLIGYQLFHNHGVYTMSGSASASYTGTYMQRGGDHHLYSSFSSSATSIIVAKDSFGSEIWRYSRETSMAGSSAITETYIPSPWEVYLPDYLPVYLPAPYGSGGTCQTSWTMSYDFGGDGGSVYLETNGASLAAEGSSHFGGNWAGDYICYSWQDLQVAIATVYADNTFFWNGWAGHSIMMKVTTTYADNDYLTPNTLTAGSFDVTVLPDSGDLPNGSTANTLLTTMPATFGTFVKGRIESVIENHIDKLQTLTNFINVGYKIYYVPYNLPNGIME